MIIISPKQSRICEPMKSDYIGTQDPMARALVNPKRDLLNEPVSSICEVCSTPLQKFTKIIAQIAEGQSRQHGYRVFCISCFSGWSPQNLDPSQIGRATFNYYICRKTHLPLTQLSGWSINQTIQLVICAQKFGPQIQQESMEQFNRVIGCRRSLYDLSLKYKAINKLFENNANLNIKYQPGKRLQIDNAGLKPLDLTQQAQILRSLDLADHTQRRLATKFMSLINYDHPIEHVRKYPDNRAEYMARALATCSITQKKIGAQYSIEGGIDEIGSVRTVKLLSKLLKEKKEKDKSIVESTSQLCGEYATLKRRIKKQALEKENQAWEKLNQLDHPELNNLINLPDMHSLLGTMIELRKERERFFGAVKEKRKIQYKYLRHPGRQQEKIQAPDSERAVEESQIREGPEHQPQKMEKMENRQVDQVE